MTTDDKIRDEKLQYDINREAAKLSALLSGKIDKYEYLTGDEILSSDQSKIIEKAKSAYCLLGKDFEKQIKKIGDQGEKQIQAVEEHRKQLVNYNIDKESSVHLKQKEIYEGIVNKRMKQIQDLSKQFDFKF